MSQGSASELQTPHLSLNPTAVPLSPLRPPGWPGEVMVSSMLTRLAGRFPGKTSQLAQWGNELGIIHLLKGPLFPDQGRREGGGLQGGLARPSLVCFLNLALVLARGLGTVPSARAGDEGERTFWCGLRTPFFRALTHFNYSPVSALS